METLLLAFTVGCAVVITARALCVLDHMSRKTRWWVKWVYTLECAGATLMALLPLMGYQMSAGALILLAGVTVGNLYDGRTYPPRLMRARHRGRRQDDIEQRGSTDAA